MQNTPNRLYQQLEKRKFENSLRSLSLPSGLIDFCSNDYLGLSRSEELYDQISSKLDSTITKSNGATGSRLISGNNKLAEDLEIKLSQFFKGKSALFFNSGYSANQSILSSIPKRGDTIFYDDLVHASIKDGLRLSFANKMSFKHNDLEDLQRKLKRSKGDIYVVVESIYSMDGDICPLRDVVRICENNGAYLVVDEAHSVGVTGSDGSGLCIKEQIHDKIFARIYTFGKALGVHGACVVGDEILTQYLMNFSRPFIYTTALPPHSIISVDCALDYQKESQGSRKNLSKNIDYFQSNMKGNDMSLQEKNVTFIESSTAIQGVIIPGNTTVRNKALELQASGLDVRPILSPTVKVGTERLRICLHAFNTFEEIDLLVEKIIKA